MSFTDSVRRGSMVSASISSLMWLFFCCERESKDNHLNLNDSTLHYKHAFQCRFPMPSVHTPLNLTHHFQRNMAPFTIYLTRKVCHMLLSVTLHDRGSALLYKHTQVHVSEQGTARFKRITFLAG
jgi:hypothetical protein